ncbi:MAG: hypothetical protein WAW13_05210 [Minisyncoccia bacterium]
MVEIDLRISKRLAALLPPLTDEEKEQLKANIKADGRVTDPILYWNDGKQNIVVDGMHRFDIARRDSIPYHNEPIEIGKTYEDVEVWILNRQLGRRNLLSPAAQRKLVGELYNRLKGCRGGDHKSEESKSQIDTLIADAAETVAKKAGVSPATVKRDGARVEALAKCAPSIQKGIALGAFKVADADLKTLAKLTPEDQQAVALVLRKGQAQTVKTAMEKAGVKPPAKKKPKPSDKPDYGKCPVCAGVKWREVDGNVICAKCQHPNGEPAGDPDEERLKTQRQKTAKTAEALMRAFDDLVLMHPQTCKVCELTEDDSTDPIRCCKRLLAIAKGWK